MIGSCYSKFKKRKKIKKNNKRFYLSITRFLFNHDIKPLENLQSNIKVFLDDSVLKFKLYTGGS